MAQLKFGRNYILTVQIDDAGDTIVIQPPFTIEFDIVRNVLSSANVCEIRIYNLSATSRNLLLFNFSNNWSLRTVTLQAGYGTNLPVIFSGNISQAWSFREGVDFISTIQCFDGGFAFVNGMIPDGTTFPAQTPTQSIYTSLMTNYLPGTSFGSISDNLIKDDGGNLYTTARSTSYSGNTAQTLSDLSGNAFFIDNSTSYLLSTSDYLDGQIGTINAQTGLLGTPLRQNNIISFDMIFEPSLIVGQLVQLQSLTYPILNTNNNNVDSFYKIISVKHRGVISESVCGEAITTGQFFAVPPTTSV